MTDEDQLTNSGDGDAPPNHAELFERAREAVTALRTATRPGGKIRPGEMLNLRHGLRSEKLIEQPDIAEWHQEQVAAITSDLGGDSELTTNQRGIVRELARLEVIVAALGTELLAGGVLTAKGQTRAAMNAYLSVLDRYTKLCGVLGLERRAKRIDTLSEIMREPR